MENLLLLALKIAILEDYVLKIKLAIATPDSVDIPAAPKARSITLKLPEPVASVSKTPTWSVPA